MSKDTRKQTKAEIVEQTEFFKHNINLAMARQFVLMAEAITSPSKASSDPQEQTMRNRKIFLVTAANVFIGFAIEAALNHFHQTNEYCLDKNGQNVHERLSWQAKYRWMTSIEQWKTVEVLDIENKIVEIMKFRNDIAHPKYERTKATTIEVDVSEYIKNPQKFQADDNQTFNEPKWYKRISLKATKGYIKDAEDLFSKMLPADTFRAAARTKRNTRIVSGDGT